METESTIQPAMAIENDPSTASVNRRIAELTDQLRQENEKLAQLMDRQRQLHLELLAAQEESLAELMPQESC